MLFVVLCPGTPECATGSGSGFKASQKTGQRLKVSSDRLGEAGNRTENLSTFNNVLKKVHVLLNRVVYVCFFRSIVQDWSLVCQVCLSCPCT